MLCGIRSTKIAARFVVLVAVFVALVPSPFLLAPVHAQGVGATLSGAVTDQSGGIVANATISIKNIATAVERSVTTDSSGIYSAPNLSPGNYEVTTTAPGFSSQVQTGITLTVGARQVLNFSLQVGSVSQTLEVVTEAPTVQLTSSDISGVVNATTVRELPLNGRSWTDLATLQPGVAAVQTQPDFSVGANRGNRGFGNQISISGARPEQNNYRLDGISLNDYANSAPGSVMGGDLGVDAIEEFSVVTGNYSADYGKTSGGVVNAVTRSGTNGFHGSAYEFIRNSHLDAANFFDNAGGFAKPPFRRNQFGITAGAPILKDKLFVFGDYEGIRQSKGITSPLYVPSNAVRNGTLCSTPDNPSSPCTLQQLVVDPSVAKYLPFWPSATSIVPGSNGDVGLYTFAAQQVINENFYTFRVDYKISARDSITGTYLRDIAPYTSPDGTNAVLIDTETRRQMLSLEETHTFSSALVNTARFGYSRDHVLNDFGTTAINPLAKDASLAAMPNEFAAQVTPGATLTMFTGGVGANSHYIYGFNSFQAYDDAFWIHGTHSLKFGGATERVESNQFSVNDPGGIFTFASLSDFITNIPSRFSTTFESTVKPRGLRQSLFGLYVQDDWRARPSLTLNLGLRWEMTTIPTEAHNQMGGFLLCLTCQPTPIGSNPISNNTLRNFEPRVGFAWDPFHNGKTAVRGGFGIFDVFLGTYPYFGLTGENGTTSKSGSVNKPGQGTFYAGVYPLLKISTAHGNTLWEQYPHRSYVMQWNLNVQRELAPKLTALVGYVGSRGVHQLSRVDDRNIVLPTLTPYGYLFPASASAADRINPAFTSIGGSLFDENTFYNALEAGVQKTMSHGVQFQTSFTWGRSIDSGSAVDHGDQFGNSISSLPWYDLKSVRGPSDFNISRTLVISATWQVPSLKSFSGPAAWITNGWQVGGIYKASDGVPFTATYGTGADPQGLNNSDDWAFPNRLTGPGCATLTNPGNPNNYIKTQCFAVPTAPNLAFYNANCNTTVGNAALLQCFNLRGNAGRNILIGPGTSNLDFSIFKNNYIKRISDSFNAQFRAELFNVLNRATFAVPATPSNTDIFNIDSNGNAALNTAAGLITSTQIDSRQIQFALKFVW
jgi:hypothetical protein